METIIDYVFRKEKSMDALDLWTKKNIRNYLGDSDEKNDKRYPPSMQKIRKLIREEKKYILKKYISKSLVQTKYHKKAHKFFNEIKSLELIKK